jgi:site-specific recombinase XerD
MDTPLAQLIDRFSQYQTAAGRARGTIQRYQITFRLFTRFLSATDRPESRASLTGETMQAFALHLRDTPIHPQHGTTRRAEAGIHAHLRDLRAFTRWLNQAGLLDEVIRYPMPKLPRRLFRILTDDEMARLWQSKYLTGSGALSVRNRAMLALMLDTGLRREEVASLTLESINLNSRRLTVIGKGNKERQMVFSPTVRDMVREFLSIRGVDDEPLFHLTANGIKTMFRRIQLDVGLEKFHPHQCRHQFATTMLRRGEHLEVIGVMLGHDDYNTTRRYLSIDDTDIARAHEAASPFDTMMGQTAPPAPSRPRQRYSNRRTTG